MVHLSSLIFAAVAVSEDVADDTTSLLQSRTVHKIHHHHHGELENNFTYFDEGELMKSSWKLGDSVDLTFCCARFINHPMFKPLCGMPDRKVVNCMHGLQSFPTYCPESCAGKATTQWVGGGDTDHNSCCDRFVAKEGKEFCTKFSKIQCDNEPSNAPSWYCPETCGAATTKAATTKATTTKAAAPVAAAVVEEKCPMDNNGKFPSQFMCHEKGVVDETLKNAQTPQKYDAVAQSVKDLFGPISTSCTNDACPRAEFAACILRMAGHDFMDFDGNNGGSDGCINFDDPDNKGLKPCLFVGENNQHLNMAYEKHAHEVSLADFLVIAGEAVMALERDTPVLQGQQLGDLFRDQFVWGRKTNHDCSNNVHLPLPGDSCEANKKTFIDALSLTWRETAAIMGVHTLGRARTKNSGFNGWWSDHKSASHFDNNYYHSLAQKGWMQAKAEGNGGKIQWIRAGNGSSRGSTEMMLNTDMCLLYAKPDGSDIKAEDPALGGEEGCCAWIMPGVFDNFGLSAADAVSHVNNKDKGLWCGFNGHLSDDFMFVKHWCCGMGQIRPKQNGPRNGFFGPGATDCNDAINVKNGKLGPAAKDVLEFAADEDAWIKVFLEAWGKATKKGVIR